MSYKCSSELSARIQKRGIMLLSQRPSLLPDSPALPWVTSCSGVHRSGEEVFNGCSAGKGTGGV